MEKITELEFNYAQATSLQAQQDRLSLLNFYLALYAAGLTVALGAGNLALPALSENIYILLFGLTLISFIFILKFVRLRQAWLESVTVMNKLKKYYLDKNPELNEYLLWQMKTIPAAHKLNTISFFSALLVSILGAASLAIAFLSLKASLEMAAAVGLIYLTISVATYYLLLKYNK